jgi:hypothetical protein
VFLEHFENEFADAVLGVLFDGRPQKRVRARVAAGVG